VLIFKPRDSSPHISCWCSAHMVLMVNTIGAKY